MDDFRRIQSLTHPLVKHLVRLRVEKKYRDEQQRVLVVGLTIVEELSKEHLPLSILHANSVRLPGSLAHLPSIEASERVIEKITGLTLAEPVVAEFASPKEASLHHAQRLLVLEEIQDPGNMGTLIRSAAALKWDSLLLLGKTVDPFNDKALRASRASIFHLPFRRGDLSVLTELIVTNGLTAFVGDVRGAPFAPGMGGKKLALALGSESKGPSKGLRELCRPIAIPLSPKVESLNVAAAGSILLYSLPAPQA